MWRDIPHPHTGRLLFRYDPERMLVEIQQRGEKLTVDLAQFGRGVLLPIVLSDQVAHNEIHIGPYILRIGE